MRYQIDLTRSKPITTAVVRSRVPAKELAQFVPAACGEVWSFIRSAGFPRPGRHLALYLDAQGSSRSRGRSIGTVRRQRADSLLAVARRPCGDYRPLRSLRAPCGRAYSYSPVVRRAWAQVFGYLLGDLRSLGGELEHRFVKDTHRCFLSASGSNGLTAAPNRKGNYETIDIGSG